MHASHISLRVFKFNWDFTLIKANNLEAFMWLNKFLPITETLLWLKLIILTIISLDFTLSD